MNKTTAAEVNRLLHNLCRIGTIDELDFVEKKLKVKLSDTQNTAWLNWPAEIGNNFVRWRPLRLQTSVLILCPSGDISQGHIVGMMYSQTIQPTTTDETLDIISFEDGTQIQYDSAAKALSVTVKGNVSIEATGDANIKAANKTTIEGLEVILTDGAGGGVVCQKHVCAFTGGPHPQGSATVKAGA